MFVWSSGGGGWGQQGIWWREERRGGGPSARLRGAAELRGDLVGDGVEEGAHDRDRAAGHLDRRHRLAESDRAADDDDRALRRVRDRVRHPRDRFERERRHL